MQEHERTEWIDQMMLEMTAREVVRPLSLLSVNRAYLWTHLQCDAPDADENVKESLDSIGLAKSHIERVWNNCSDLFRCIHGKEQAQQGPVDLCVLLREIAEEKDFVERSLGVTLEIKLPEKSCCVITDMALAERILLNLLSNALKLSQPGEKVVLSLKQDGADVLLQVQDHCGGMAESYIHILCGSAEEMEDFHYMGGGLGLHLCRELCGLLHWTPTVQTNSRGSVITLRIPDSQTAWDSQLQFCSQGEQNDLARAERQARLRLELGSVPGLEAYWTR